MFLIFKISPIFLLVSYFLRKFVTNLKNKY